MKNILNNHFTKFIFFGNYFYGLCAIVLSLEATLQQKLSPNSIWYYCCVFCVTVVFYTLAYMTNNSGYPSNDRNNWYYNHRKFVKYSQFILILYIIIYMCWFVFMNLTNLRTIYPSNIIIPMIFIAIAVLYYGFGGNLNIRKFGNLKPFFIGFTWAGIVTIFPAIVTHITDQTEFHFTLINLLLFLKNFMFISILCIMFDIKDYISDSEHNLNTIVVRKGIRSTLLFVVIPLCLAGLAAFLIYGLTHNFNAGKMIINSLPYLLMIAAAYSLKKTKPIMYYLVFIDGLMLVKGICGIIAIKYF